MYRVKINLSLSEYEEERSYPSHKRTVAEAETTVEFPVPGDPGVLIRLVTSQVEHILSVGAAAYAATLDTELTEPDGSEPTSIVPVPR